MDRKDEIIQLQMDVISQMTRNNLSRLADDLWGPMAAPKAPAAPVDAPAKEETPAVSGDTAPATEEKKEPEAEEEPLTIEELRKELESYIGLETVKHEVESLINLVTVQNLRKEHGLPVNDLSLHMVFSGNPGTGKTMIARLMAKVYKCLGILSKGHLTEVDRSGLVAGYVGQTAIKTSEVIEKAMGGVLFIDEAYALTNHSENDFGQEAVDTLLKAMEDHRDDLIVIVAGYTQLMKDFIHSNPGLESRFNRFLEFPDYTVDEMVAIFQMRCEQSGYELAKDAEQLLKTLLALYSLDASSFGNARGVRNLFERAVSAQANRLATAQSLTREDLVLLTADDIRVAGGGEENMPLPSEKGEAEPRKTREDAAKGSETPEGEAGDEAARGSEAPFSQAPSDEARFGEAAIASGDAE